MSEDEKANAALFAHGRTAELEADLRAAKDRARAAADAQLRLQASRRDAFVCA